MNSSKKLEDAHYELQKRWDWIIREYALRHPNEPLPKVNQTYRNKIDQNVMFERGASKVKFPNSTHNLYPSWALDYYFVENGETSYREELVNRVGELAEEIGLFWGKRWGWDAAHLALVEKVDAATTENLKKLPALPVYSQDWKVKTYGIIQDGDDIITRVSITEKTIHIRGEKR